MKKQIQQFHISLEVDKINIAVVKDWCCLSCERTSNIWSYNSNPHYDPSDPG
jgi:hypothetical protein